jgi:small-conductance mechanosensitive channel
MEELLSSDRLLKVIESARDWFLANVLVVDNLLQLLVVAVAFGLAHWFGSRLAGWLGRIQTPMITLRRLLAVVAGMARPLLWLLFLWGAIFVAIVADWPHRVLGIVISLLTAWVVIRFISSLAVESTWTRLIAWGVWTIAALNILDLLDKTIAVLDAPSFVIGALTISPYRVIKAMTALALLLWAATYLGSLMDTRINTSHSLSPSLKVLISKLFKFTLIGVAVLIALHAMGIGSSLAVFSGAIGLGIGFGMQRVIANLVSGVVLLLDKSIKPGDVIAIKGTYGWVNTLGGRYVSVITRDGTEHLIPNELLITEYVENWTHTDNNVRLKVSVNVHYKSDVRKAIELCVAAALETRRVLDQPAPTCLLREFADSSLKLEIRIWINDPTNGVSNVRSEVMLRVWDKFREHGIEIPYPQRDVHVVTDERVPVERLPAELGRPADAA